MTGGAHPGAEDRLARRIKKVVKDAETQAALAALSGVMAEVIHHAAGEHIVRIRLFGRCQDAIITILKERSR